MELFKNLSKYVLSYMCVCISQFFLRCPLTSHLTCPIIHLPHHISSIHPGLKLWSHLGILPSLHLFIYHRIKEVDNIIGLADIYVSTFHLRMYRRQLHKETKLRCDYISVFLILFLKLEKFSGSLLVISDWNVSDFQSLSGNRDEEALTLGAWKVSAVPCPLFLCAGIISIHFNLWLLCKDHLKLFVHCIRIGLTKIQCYP